MDKFYEKRNSCIIDIFYGFQEDIYKCNYCSFATFNFQGFSVLNIPIMKRNNVPIYSLEEGIQYFQEIQNHNNENGFICQKCQCKNIATQSRIIYCPKIFIINFKRIGENNFYSHNVKIPFDFRIKNLVDGNYYEYTLIGFIKHYGGGNSGHNIAICKNFFDSIWYEYDDSRVTNIHNTSNIIENVIVTSGSFLFFYIKKNYIIGDDDKNLIKNLSKELRKLK
jgi:ubiquitin C-terminal hydrolase